MLPVHARGRGALLVLTRNHYDGQGGYTAYYYLFDKNRFRLLLQAEERFPEAESSPSPEQ